MKPKDIKESQEELKQIFIYKDGQLFWREKTNNRINTVNPAGNKTPLGYVRVRINNEMYMLHRVVYKYFHGEVTGFIDHIDGNRSNNKIENLRLCSWGQNQQNAKLKSNNKSGYKGVSWSESKKRWLCRIMANGKMVLDCRFKDKEDAIEKVRTEREKHHKQFANHG